MPLSALSSSASSVVPLSGSSAAQSSLGDVALGGALPGLLADLHDWEAVEQT